MTSASRARLLRPVLVWGIVSSLGPSLARAGEARAFMDLPATGAPPTAETAASELLRCEVGDVDADGVCDEVEASTGTRPLRADTDADGVPDGVEDADRDGVVDPGESDPRVPGLFPGVYPHIPEPMVFDLVRGLGARKGELEVNSLVVLGLRPGNLGLAWAPEVEWAFEDGLAVELELPMQDRELEAMKGAFQATFPPKREHLIHGAQFIGEYLFDARSMKATALYLAGGRVGAWSVLAMLGARALTPMDTRAHYQALINPGIYNDVSETLTAGVEYNVALGVSGHHVLAAIPQVHTQLSKNVRLQLGGGARLEGRNLHPLVATRIIVE